MSIQTIRACGLRRLETSPFLHRLCRATAETTVVRRVNPRLVIRNVDHQITLSTSRLFRNASGALQFVPPHGRRASFCGVGHHAVARIQANINHLRFKRDNFRTRVLAQYRCRNQGRNVDAANRCSCALRGDRSLANASNPKYPGRRKPSPETSGTFRSRNLHCVLQAFATTGGNRDSAVAIV